MLGIDHDSPLHNGAVRGRPRHGYNAEPPQGKIRRKHADTALGPWDRHNGDLDIRHTLAEAARHELRVGQYVAISSFCNCADVG